ncbi:MAG: ATP synthase F1 subunit gamma [Deltaproteobacteria bacterium]|nr:ATP synthase F1 subunit gamma [Deltaproteobacteria bacterium]NIS76806.1 ATP synthase F1 subunit gamma [Deltaproteobacteria bacterium]
MSSLRAIRKRITSVKNTQQITKAMKMVSAARLRRAQDAIMAARPYAFKIREAVFDLAYRVDVTAHPLLSPRDVQKQGVLIITSDRGLCGSFNSSVIKELYTHLQREEGSFEEVGIYTVGRKASEFFRRRRKNIKKDYLNVLANVTFAVAEELSREVTDDFLRGEIDELIVYFNEFRSVISQRVTVEKLLPIEVERKEDEFPVEFIFEPGKDEILATLLPRYVATQIFRYLLESAAGEHGARMTAMDAATNNASEMIDKLTLQMNRARQASITKELMEIIGGKEAIEHG